MCIRDRELVVAFHHIEELVLVRVDVQGWSSFRGVADLLKHCLLYTSDAADERSSVDLGGRRIIKKKKNITYRSSTCHNIA